MTLKFKINKNGNLERTCPKGNLNPIKCKECDDLLSMPSFYGRPLSVICRGSGIEGMNRKNKFYKKGDTI